MKLLQNLRKDKKGFTLIEVVIVLAIAALILVIVFLAVQGAQKSQRDNAAKQGASRAIAAAQNFLSDNGGSPSPAVIYTVAVTSANCDLNGGTACGDFGKYFKDVVGHGGKSFWLGNDPVNSVNDRPRVTLGHVCNGGVMVASASYSNAAAVYWSESANKSVCISN
jgi:prepilin-type N-terminal cleavage/methylation domain-containing protein